MSSTKCHFRLPQLRQHRKARRSQRSDNRGLRWQPSESHYLLLGQASSLAEFLLQQQACATLGFLTDTAPPPHPRHQVLLGFENLGHFLDWLDTGQNTEKPA